MITLAVLTGISAEQWAKEGRRAIDTAFEVLRRVRGIDPEPAPAEEEHPNKYGG